MLLFDAPTENLLPYDGIVTYHPSILTPDTAAEYFNRLFTSIEWKHDETVIMGKRIVTKRKVAWYADSPYEYAYSGTTKTALPWTDDLMDLRRLAEEASRAQFNSCLLNLYHNGNEGLGWHSDNEDSLVKNAAIAAISLGAERRFDLMHKKTKQKVSIMLENGSLLAMKGPTQSLWIHSLPKSSKVVEPRISLTFRRMLERS
jgi:alkylated DNA repair dioxygenase AlkB